MHWGSAAWSSDCHCNVACNVFVQAGATAPRRSQLHGVLHAQCATPVLRPPLLCSTQEALARLLLFTKLDAALQRKIVAEMYERTVVAGEILIKEGDTGLGASELFVVKSGKFEVGCWRLGAWHAQHAMQVAHLHGLFRHASAAALAHSISACSVSAHACASMPATCLLEGTAVAGFNSRPAHSGHATNPRVLLLTLSPSLTRALLCTHLSAHRCCSAARARTCV